MTINHQIMIPVSSVPSASKSLAAYGWKSPWIVDGEVVDQRNVGDDRDPIGGKALNLNGVDQYVNLGNQDLTQLTFSSWVWIPSVAPDMALLSNTRDSSGTYNGFQIQHRSSGLNFRLWDNTNSIVAAPVLPIGTWVHVACTYDGLVARIYYNGVEVASENYLDAIGENPAHNLYIGRMGIVDLWHFAGRLWDFRIYEFGLNASQVKELHDKRHRALPKIQPLFYLPFEVYDQSTVENIGSQPDAVAVGFDATAEYSGSDVPGSRLDDIGYGIPENLVTHDFSDAFWTKRGLDIQSGFSDPTGGNTAFRFTENDTNNNPAIRTVDLSDGNEQEFSVWIRSDTPIANFPISTNGTQITETVDLTTEWTQHVVKSDLDSVSGPHIGGFGSIARGSGISFDAWMPELRSTKKISASLDGKTDRNGNPLTKKGRAPKNAKPVGSHCISLNGVDQAILDPTLTGAETVISSGGTSNITIAAGQIQFTSGTAWDIRLSNGTVIPCSEGAGSSVHTLDGRVLVIGGFDASVWSQTQDEYHRNMTEGFNLVGGAKIPAASVSHDVLGTKLSNPRNPKGNNGSETKISFSHLHNCVGFPALNDHSFGDTQPRLSIKVQTAKLESKLSVEPE